MKRHTSKIIVGSAFSLASIAVAIDHTQHQLPEVEQTLQEAPYELEQTAPCSLAAPCSLGGKLGGKKNNDKIFGAEVDD